MDETDGGGSLDCSAEIARQKLLRLSDQGRIDGRKTGRQRLWWLPVHSQLATDSPEQTLQHLSQKLDKPIVVGDTAVYEDGDRHALSDTESER